MAGSASGRTAVPLLRILPRRQTAQRTDESAVQPPPCGNRARRSRPEEVEKVREAGGEFIISPNARSSVIRRTKELGLLSMPGFATPGEAFDAMDAGADLLKVFPCGSPENVSVLKSVIPLPVFAVGGIGKENKRAYLRTADGVGVGIGIFRPEQSPEELYESAKEFLEA